MAVRQASEHMATMLGKNSCVAYGSFCVARMSHGGYDWFPVGQPPNINGEVDRQAQIVAKYYWNGRVWRRVDH
jgi:hypothetical protein